MSKADEMMAAYLANETGPTALFVILQGIRLEIKIPGMRMTRKAPKCSTILRQRFGLSGKPPKLLAQYEALLIRHGLGERMKLSQAPTTEFAGVKDGQDVYSDGTNEFEAAYSV